VCNGFGSEGAVGTPTISHHLAVSWHLVQSLLELREWDGDSVRKVPGRELLGRPDVDHEQVIT
jgi:hypothetical protein